LKLSKATFVTVLAAVLLALPACGTMKRLGKDAYVTVISPVLIPMAAGSDAYTDSVEVRRGYEGEGFTQVIAFPVLFLWHGIKHTGIVGVHILDILFTPFYGLAEMSNFGPEIEPLDYYENTWFDQEGDGTSGTDAESGSAAPASAGN
jgi:hypothetical protein